MRGVLPRRNFLQGSIFNDSASLGRWVRFTGQNTTHLEVLEDAKRAETITTSHFEGPGCISSIFSLMVWFGIDIEIVDLRLE